MGRKYGCDKESVEVVESLCRVSVGGSHVTYHFCLGRETMKHTTTVSQSGTLCRDRNVRPFSHVT